MRRTVWSRVKGRVLEISLLTTTMSGRNGGHKLSAIEAGMPRVGACARSRADQQKRFYRQRAHANPLSIHHLDYPSSPAVLQWPTHYPASVDSPTILDIGCGFGGLLISLAPLYPATNLLGIEIRTQVTQYVQDKIRALRVNPDSKDADDVVPEAIDPRLLPDAGYHYENVSVLRGNAMKYLPNFFPKASVGAPPSRSLARTDRSRSISCFSYSLIPISRSESIRLELSARLCSPSTPTSSRPVGISTPSQMSRLCIFGWSPTSTRSLSSVDFHNSRSTRWVFLREGSRRSKKR